MRTHELKYGFEDQSYLFVYKGDYIYRFMIVKKFDMFNEGLVESRVEEKSQVIFPTSDNEIAKAKKLTILPRIVPVPSKTNMFMTFDSDSIEVVKCYKNEKKNYFIFEHPYSIAVKCYDRNVYYDNNNPQETALIALGYKNGKVSIYHADELEKDISNP